MTRLEVKSRPNLLTREAAFPIFPFYEIEKPIQKVSVLIVTFRCFYRKISF